jgi:hypothetical protein
MNEDHRAEAEKDQHDVPECVDVPCNQIDHSRYCDG